MYTKQITYENWDGVTVTESFEFNISHDQLSENMHLQTELEELQRIYSGDARQLTPEEVSRMVEMVKAFMKIAYGVRSADRKRFRQADTEPEVWNEFRQTAGYRALLKQLFTGDNDAVEFLIGVMPADMRPEITQSVDELRKGIEFDLAKKTPEVPTAPPLLATPAPAPAPSTDVSDEELLKMEPGKMTHEQLQRAFILKSK